MLEIELPMKEFRVLIHLDGVVKPQEPRIGTQEKIEPRRLAIAQATTNAPTILVAMVNP